MGRDVAGRAATRISDAGGELMKTVSDDELIAALEAHGTEGAARELGINRRTVQRRKSLLVFKGYSPQHDMTHTVPDGYLVRGVSTYYNKDGEVSGQWVKSRDDAERQRELMQAALDGMADSVTRAAPVKAPKIVAADRLNLFVVTDYHLGMLAWGEETRGENWDTDIAERTLRAWFDCALSEISPAETAVFAQLGDFLHFDGLESVTPLHRNVLDADTRYPKLVRVAQRAVSDAIIALLGMHKRVHVIMAEGNHDMAGSVWLREATAHHWANNKRVTVDTSPDPYYCVEHGDTSLFFHHGHLRRPGNIDATFAEKFRDVFGRTKYSYAHMGHMHHEKTVESAMMQVTQYGTLAACDAYASRGGWIAQRSAPVITYHKKYGRIFRRDIGPQEVADWTRFMCARAA